MSREQILERERRWARPAGIAAIVPLLLYIAALAIEQSAGLAGGNSEAEQLRSLHDHSSAILASSVVQTIAVAILPLPLLYLFRAAQARNPRVQGAFVAFVFIGPLLIAAQSLVGGLALKSVSSDFVTRASGEASKPLAAFNQQLAKDPESIEKVTVYTVSDKLEIQQKDGTFYAVSYPNDQESRIQDSLNGKVDHKTDSDTGVGPPDALASHLSDDSTGLQVTRDLLIPAALGFIVAIIYTSLQALRAGLLTRSVGSLGIALGAAFILLGRFAVIGTLGWAAYLGLLYLDRQRGPRPPAWAAAVAIPWPRPGEEMPAAAPGDGAIEGEATELDAGDQEASASGAKSPRSKRKRKRRR